MLTVQAPPSKSVSHRTVMGAALAAGDSVVRNVLESKDLERTIGILNAVGARIRARGNGEYAVTGMAGKPRGGTLPDGAPLSCDVHESGTTCRLLTGVLAAGEGRFRIHGAPRMHERPIGELTAALEHLGVRVTCEQRLGCPPLLLETSGLEGDEVHIGLDESSQYLSGLLLAAPLSRKGLTITLGGRKVVSWPYVGLTLQTLEDFGPAFAVEKNDGEGWKRVDWRTLMEARPGGVRFVVSPGNYRAGDYTVEGDWSGASYFLAAGAVGGRPLRVVGLNINSLQGDRALLSILRRMGARIDVEDHGVVVTPAPLHGIEIDMGACPDLVPTVAVVAAFASGSTVIRNVAHLRIKESDRIAAPAEELRKAGIAVEEREDGMMVHGGTPRIPAGTVFRAHGDHRIAMSMALLGFSGGVVALDNPGVVAKSFPHFWDLWRTVL